VAATRPARSTSAIASSVGHAKAGRDGGAAHPVRSASGGSRYVFASVAKLQPKTPRPSSSARRFAQVPNDGALLPAPSYGSYGNAAASPSRLPPRILAMLAATPSHPDHSPAAPATPPASAATAPSGATGTAGSAGTTGSAAAVATVGATGAPTALPTNGGASSPAVVAAGAAPAAFGPALPGARGGVPPVPVDVRYAMPRDFTARASDLMATHVIRVAQRAEPLVRRVLWVADRADDPLRADEVRAAASAVTIAPQDPLFGYDVADADARAFHEAAKSAWGRGSVADALELQTKAFGANPIDAAVAGNLAFLQLRQRTINAGLARDLALHAIALHDARYPQGRVEDWTTLAVADALTGRERESRDAWLASLALAPSPERQCRAALNAYAAWGEPLRAPVEAMLHRAQRWGLADRSPLCEWPPHWVTAAAAR
jgi:hypothetical protein